MKTTHCHHCGNPATDKIRIQNADCAARDFPLCADCMKKIQTEGAQFLDMDAAPPDRAIAVSVEKSATHIRVKITCPMRPEITELDDSEVIPALLLFLSQTIAAANDDDAPKSKLN